MSPVLSAGPMNLMPYKWFDREVGCAVGARLTAKCQLQEYVYAFPGMKSTIAALYKRLVACCEVEHALCVAAIEAYPDFVFPDDTLCHPDLKIDTPENYLKWQNASPAPAAKKLLKR